MPAAHDDVRAPEQQSFKFYDSVQSGQLISRANSDIRAIQMFLGFGPMLAVSALSFVAALVLMLSMDVKLTLVSDDYAAVRSTSSASTCARSLFPISWS